VLQILVNLIGNALNYTPAGSVIRIAAGRDEAMAWVSVTDEGAGIPAEAQAKIFNKFERLGRSGDGGTGLGLYISRKLALAMRGQLTVANAPHSGACFTLSLPAREG
jgi:signal transduction histidine kinase